MYLKNRKKSVEAEEKLKQIEINFMIDLKTLTHKISVNMSSLQEKELPKNFLRFSAKSPNVSVYYMQVKKL